MREAGASRPPSSIYSSHVRTLLVLSALALVATAGAQATQSRGTLTGVVTRGPISPACVAEQPCDEPAAHVTLVFSRGEVVVRAETGRDGRYRLRLPAGIYSVRRGSASAPDRKLQPLHVRVVAGRVRTVDFSIENGIR